MEGDEKRGPLALDTARLAEITRFARIDEASYADIEAVVRGSGAGDYLPERDADQDPRSDIWISRSESRRSRPLSGAAGDDNGGEASCEDGREVTSCIVCDCRLTPAVDVTSLTEGHSTFATPNLYPMVYPFPPAECGGGRGLHLIQWCSTEHDADLHNMSWQDMETVIERLAALEEFLLHGEGAGFPGTGEGHTGFAALMKNRGLKVGGSVEHGHQQIAHLSVLPRALAADADYLGRNGQPYAAALRKAAGAPLTVAEFPGGVSAVAAPWMRRPLEVAILPADGAGAFLHHLADESLKGIAEALRVITGALQLLMELRGMSFDYNLAFHTGPVGLLYIEVLPWTQPYGGFEHLGHYLCQETPATSVRHWRNTLGYR